MSKNRIQSLDGMRLIAAFLVVCLHTPSIFPPQVSAIISNIARIAVPFFLIISGYYIQNDNKQIENTNIKKAVFKIFKILIWAIIFYFLIDIIIFQ